MINTVSEALDYFGGIENMAKRFKVRQEIIQSFVDNNCTSLPGTWHKNVNNAYMQEEAKRAEKEAKRIEREEARELKKSNPAAAIGRPKQLDEAVTLSFTIEKAHLPMILDMGNGNRSAGLRAILASSYEKFNSDQAQ